MEINNIKSVEKESCTGCKMCMDSCPTQAIYFEAQNDGFWYPNIDSEKCIQCGLCYKKCPAVNASENKNNSNPTVYSLWSNDDSNRTISTSGGVFWEIGEWFIKHQGVVAGARYGADWRSAEHYIAQTLEELNDLRGSKYFQSDTAGIYKQVKNYLDKEVEVLFCGTPCQNAALHAFLGKDYKNLFTMDFICRSINSPKAFKAYIDELESIYNSKVKEVHLKDKERGWQSLASRVVFEDGKISLNDRTEDKWVQGFIGNDLYTRESCYNCKYKVIPRVTADLTIGDFWGIKNQSESDMHKGISVLLINSKKGMTIFDKVKDRFTYHEHNLEDVIPGNPALLQNPKKSDKSDMFFDLLNKGVPFSRAVDKCISSNNKNLLLRGLKKVYRIIRQAYVYFGKNQISVSKFIYYNYFCKHIVRSKGTLVLPHKNAIFNFEEGSKIIIKAGKLEVGFNKLRGSKSETHIRMNKNAIWNCNNGALIFYNTVLEIKENATFDSGFFSVNGGSVIIIHKCMKFGEDVMLGRNIIIYDSDFHSLYNKHYRIVNVPETVIIEDHVWITTNVMVQKGVTIGHDSLIAAYTVVNKDIPPYSIVGGKSTGEVIRDWVYWDRKICPLSIEEINQ